MGNDAKKEQRVREKPLKTSPFVLRVAPGGTRKERAQPALFKVLTRKHIDEDGLAGEEGLAG